MTFRLWTIFYVFALFAAAMATFGPGGGIATSALVLGVWAWVFFAPKRPQSLLLQAIIALMALFVLGALLLPAISLARPAAQRSACVNNLKQLQLALLNYEMIKRTFPPAYIADANGKPMHSWRVLILPYLGETALYSKYNFNEPWDGPNNRKLAPLMPNVFRCPAHDHATGPAATETHYFAIVSPETAWPGAVGRPIKQFTDGLSKTICLVEASGLGIHWMEPRDPTFDEALELLTKKPNSGHTNFVNGFLTRTYYEGSYRHAAFCDGHVQWLAPLANAPQLARALLTAAGGPETALTYEYESAQPAGSQLAIHPRSRTEIKWGVAWSLFVFAVLALLPAAFLKSGRKQESSTTAMQPAKNDESGQIH